MPLSSTPQVTDEVMRELTHAIEQLRYGSVEVTIYEGRVIQIERTYDFRKRLRESR